MNGTIVGVIVSVLTVVGSGVAAIRWLRIGQREHYLAPAATRFAVRWWRASTGGVLLASLALLGIAGTLWLFPLALVTVVVVAAGPPGLSLKGGSSPLAWTDRLKRAAVGLGAIVVAGGVAGALWHPVIPATIAMALPLALDLVLFGLAPLEKRLGRPWVTKAARALAGSGATVVAITGSYGKTTTKAYVAQLLAGVRPVLASPASFNNRMGLARAINEHLSGGIDVFVAEMGTYSAGEIAELCTWIPPDVAVITAIGPVHLERFGSEDAIVVAKSEILENAPVAVLNVDDPRLAELANRQSARRRIIRVGTGGGEDVTVAADGSVFVAGERIGEAPALVHRTNLACALGVVLGIDEPVTAVAGALSSVSDPDHRATLSVGASGVKIIDDTFNSNPAGAAAALSRLAALDVSGQKIVVTPGMVEMGKRQYEANRRFAAEAASVADRIVIVGRTNKAALVEGADPGPAKVLMMNDRGEAVSWVRSTLGPNDAVLYENDLPDHYP